VASHLKCSGLEVGATRETDLVHLESHAAVGAIALMAPTSFDAAAIVRTTSSDISVKISGTGSGMLIAEVYDTTPGDEFTSLTPRVINMPVLKQVGEGMTVGIVVAGVEAKPLLIRRGSHTPKLASAWSDVGAALCRDSHGFRPLAGTQRDLTHHEAPLRHQPAILFEDGRELIFQA
jgi:hypothetical protein